MIWPKLTWKCNAFLNGPFDVIFPCLRLVLICMLNYFLLFNLKEEKLRGRPGYEHLNEPLHILIEADLPGSVVDIRLRQAQEIIEELLKPVVCISNLLLLIFFYFEIGHNFITDDYFYYLQHVLYLYLSLHVYLFFKTQHIWKI